MTQRIDKQIVIAYLSAISDSDYGEILETSRKNRQIDPMAIGFDLAALSQKLSELQVSDYHLGWFVPEDPMKGIEKEYKWAEKAQLIKDLYLPSCSPIGGNSRIIDGYDFNRVPEGEIPCQTKCAFCSQPSCSKMSSGAKIVDEYLKGLRAKGWIILRELHIPNVTANGCGRVDWFIYESSTSKRFIVEYDGSDEHQRDGGDTVERDYLKTLACIRAAYKFIRIDQNVNYETWKVAFDYAINESKAICIYLATDYRMQGKETSKKGISSGWKYVRKKLQGSIPQGSSARIWSQRGKIEEVILPD